MIKVLFVCLGNICRSPMAEASFKALVEQEDMLQQFFIDSAGTANYHIGELPDERMQATALQHNITLTHRARQVSIDDFDRFDYIIAMDKSNYQNVLNFKNRLNSPAEPKIMLIRSFDAQKESLEVPDPYYGSLKDFEEVYQILLRCNQHFLDFLKQEHLLEDAEKK